MKHLIFLLMALSFLQSCENKSEVDAKFTPPKENQKIQKKEIEVISKIEKNTLQSQSNKSSSKITPPKPVVYYDPEPDPSPGPFYFHEPMPVPIPEPLPEPPNPQEPEILSIAEKMPEFKGGNEKLMEFIKTNIRYPELCKEIGVQGNVYVKMIIDATGKVTQPTIARGVGENCGLEKEALRVIKLLPDFIPAENGGKKVSVYYHLPVRFRLD